MPMRDSVRVLRKSRITQSGNPTGCIYSYTHAATLPSWHERVEVSDSREVTRNAQHIKSQVRHITTSERRCNAPNPLARTSSPLDATSTAPPLFPLGQSRNVREYLQQWSTDYQAQLKGNAPAEVMVGRNIVLPNSMFARDAMKADKEEAETEEKTENTTLEADDIDVDAALAQRELQPGDVFHMDSSKVKSQLAMYLGKVGIQSQYLLADGRWFMDVQALWKGHIIHNFASEGELAAIKAHLPVKPVETVKAEQGATVHVHATGEVPHSTARPVLTRFAALTEEVEDCTRTLASTLEKLYRDVADEKYFISRSLRSLVEEDLGQRFNEMSDAYRMALLMKLTSDERFNASIAQEAFWFTIMPKDMYSAVMRTTEWARAYQDAAARAAAGQDVSDQLRKNPLTSFISKARRLITLSRKIRPPTSEGILGPTLKHAVPPSGEIERRPTGEEFTDDDKTIIQFLWTIYLKRPSNASPGLSRNQSLGSLILRAVGAYPKALLDGNMGRVLLQEMGCIEPWDHRGDHNVSFPLHFNGLNKQALLLKEKEQEELTKLNLQPGQTTPPFPDTMAHVRKDWGDLEVFCIDSMMTRIIDDGISVEPSKEYADHFWVHAHIAHPTAFLPKDHPFLERAAFMGGGYYGANGTEPCMPGSFLDTVSIAPNKEVLTVSTLLSRTGTVKDVAVQAGIVRNVIKVDNKILSEHMGHVTPLASVLRVGHPAAALQDKRDAARRSVHVEQTKVIERYMASFRLIKDLCVARWEAREREHPEHLTMRKLPTTVMDYSLHTGPIDVNHDRIFRSEHCYGDPYIELRNPELDFNMTYSEQPMKYELVGGAMLLAGESVALWMRQRNIPGIFRYQSPRDGYSVSKLNSLGPYETFLAPKQGESLEPSYNVSLNMEQHMQFTSPLRRFKDMVNAYQIDAYLKAEGPRNAAGGVNKSNPIQVLYPYSHDELMHMIKSEKTYQDVSSIGRAVKRQWTILALFRAFHFDEAKLPETWDFMVGSTAKLSGYQQKGAEVEGDIVALNVQANVVASEAGWEKMAKYRQWLPVKIQKVDIGKERVQCVAVGPPSDHPHTKDLAYPELAPEPSRAKA